MENKKKYLKTKNHLSTHVIPFEKKENGPSESFDAQNRKTATLPKISVSSLKSNSLQKFSKFVVSNQSAFSQSFFIRKDFPTQFTDKVIKTGNSIFNSDSLITNSKLNENNMDLISFKKINGLRNDIMQKGLENFLNLTKFVKLIENLFNKLIENFSFFPDIEQDVRKYIFEFEDFLYKFFKDAFSNYEMIIQENKEKDDKISELYNSLNKNKNEFSSQLTEYMKKINDSAEDQFKKIYKKTSLNEIYSNFENQKLEKENELLKNSLKTFEKSHNVNEILEKYSNYKDKADKIIEELKMNVQKKDLHIFQMTAQINFSKTANNKLEKDLNLMIEINKNLKIQLKILENEKAGLRNLSEKYKEIALMQKEDHDSVWFENVKHIKHIHALELKMKEIKKKLGYNMELLSNLKDDEFENDNNLMKQVVGFLTQEFIKSIQKDEKATRKKEDFDEIFLPKLQYYKPGFITLIKSDIMNKNDPVSVLTNLKRTSELKISPMFLATLRAVLDSKYNEMLLYEDFKQITKFPDFVYSWLSTFYVSPITRTIKLLDIDKISDIDTLREDFLLTLTSPLVSKLWECINFKEFLEERSSADELYFYLHCRFLLNKGPQLDTDAATFNYVHFVRSDYVHTLVDLIMGNYDEQTRIFIKNKITEKAKFKNSLMLIDSSFVLRIFLEYYRLERKQKFKIIKNLFLSLPTDQKIKKKIAINSFAAFKILLEKNGAICTELDKAELFRESWQIGSGEITPEIFFTVLTENNYFISVLKLKSFLNLPLTTNMINSEDYLSVTEIIMKKLQDKNIKPLIKEAESIIEETGNEKMMYFWERNLKVFSENYRFIDFSALCGKIPDLNFLNLMKILLIANNIKNFNFHLKAENYSEFNDIASEWEIYEGLINLMRKHNNNARIKEFERNKKIRKIQEFAKRRIKKWYVLINKLLKKKK